MEANEDEQKVLMLLETYHHSFIEPTGEMTSSRNSNFASSRSIFPVVEQKQMKPKYNIVAFFHCSFKIVSFVLYLVANFVGISYTLTFVLVTILLSADFWLVKNVSGRLLAGLRWWSVVEEGSGNQMTWRYEAWTDEDKLLANKFHIYLFWIALMVQETVWIFMILVAFFSFKLNWLVLATFALSLNSANLYGYIKCKLFSGTSSGFSWTSQGNQTNTVRNLVQKIRQLFSSNERAGYAQGQAGFVETF